MGLLLFAAQIPIFNVSEVMFLFNSGVYQDATPTSHGWSTISVKADGIVSADIKIIIANWAIQPAFCDAEII